MDVLNVHHRQHVQNVQQDIHLILMDFALFSFQIYQLPHIYLLLKISLPENFNQDNINNSTIGTFGIIGIVIGALAAIILAIITTFLILKHKYNRNHQASNDSDSFDLETGSEIDASSNIISEMISVENPLYSTNQQPDISSDPFHIDSDENI